mgnify:CR=1 FL=1
MKKILKTLINKGVKVFKKITKKLIKYIIKQMKYLIVGFISGIALLLDINYDFMKRRFIALSETKQEFIIYVILALSIYGAYDLVPNKRGIYNLSVNIIEKVEAKVKYELNKNNKELKLDKEHFEEQKEIKVSEETIEKTEVLEVQDVNKVEEVVDKCMMDYTSCKIKEVAIREGITDWKIPVAIARHECGYKDNQYLSNAFKNKKNVGGMMYYDTTTKSSYLMSFDTIDSGVEAFVSNLKRNYFNLGLDTIEKIQPKYAPANAANDPYGLNEFWVSGVKAFYNDI